MNYIEFFSTDNKSGWKTKESTLKSVRPDVYVELDKFREVNSLHNLTFTEVVWLFMNNVPTKPKCMGCGSEVTFKDRLLRGYNKFCSLPCANEKGDLNKLQKEAILKKYNVESTNQLESVKLKKKLSSLKKYGTESPMQNEEVKLIHKKAIRKKYGVDNIMQCEEIRNKINQTIKNKYNVDNLFQSEIIKEKMKKTNLLNLGAEYPTQSEVVKNKIKKIAFDKLKIRFPFILELNDKNLTCSCNKCNKNFIINRTFLNDRKRHNYILCTNCNPVEVGATSKNELEIFEFVKSILPNENILSGDRKILNNKELDIYIPSKNIAIEYNGLYWHSELFKANDYHLEKTNDCTELDITLIHIFEDEWKYNREIVESRLRNLFGLNENKIYARKCVVREVGIKETKEFLIKNHIQGFARSTIKLGLYFEDELVSIMTFSNGRIIMNGKKEELELVRFCNKINYSVIGGASKLFKAFLKQYNPKKVISYADKRWSVGNLYKTIGFKEIHDSKPNYWYINGDLREYRFKFRKSELIKNGFDGNKTEHQIMMERKIFRIYDCGSIRFEYNI